MFLGQTSNKNIILFNKWGISEYDLLYLGHFQESTHTRGGERGTVDGAGLPLPVSERAKKPPRSPYKRRSRGQEKAEAEPANRTVWLGDYKPTVDIGL